MEQELRALLRSSAAITGIVGGLVDWGESPQPGAARYIVLHLVSDTEGATMQGRDGLRQSRVQVDCYGPDYATAAALMAAVKDALHGYRGGGFQGIFFDGGRVPREGDDEASAIYRASLDFMTHWRSQHA